MANVSPIDVQKALHGVEYPASKDALVQAAKGNGASAEVEEAISGIADREYEGPTGVSAEIFD
ncbi:DUF2795 domain-containing protein [Kineococcus sp. SYSU DK005]|uniref:DUF2795 domain-containing protein n=1 Tax=Kineococcus sp. SYSU DK005 TaxID=3383126 RepID=UPI003D7EA0DE